MRRKSTKVQTKSPRHSLSCSVLWTLTLQMFTWLPRDTIHLTLLRFAPLAMFSSRKQVWLSPSTTRDTRLLSSPSSSFSLSEADPSSRLSAMPPRSLSSSSLASVDRTAFLMAMFRPVWGHDVADLSYRQKYCARVWWPDVADLSYRQKYCARVWWPDVSGLSYRRSYRFVVQTETLCTCLVARCFRFIVQTRLQICRTDQNNVYLHDVTDLSYRKKQCAPAHYRFIVQTKIMPFYCTGKNSVHQQCASA